MMNILILTSVYKDNTLNGKDKSVFVVNSFAREWRKMGHNVLVIHNSHRYPVFIHMIPNRIKKPIESKLGFVIASLDAMKEKHYNDAGVDVWRLPLLKMIPHYPNPKRRIRRQVKKIERILERSNFTPDVITGHWISPQLEIIAGLKEKYHCKAAIVMHGIEYLRIPSYNAKKYLEKVEHIGCRSETEARNAKRLLGLKETPFICYSGIPDDYFTKLSSNYGKFKNTDKWKFVYAGRLIKRKHVDTIIEALAGFHDVDWELQIIGEGGEGPGLKKKTVELEVDDRVIFTGAISREDVVRKMSEAHCFIMVSDTEIFGLVYLEAMASSCITVGAVGEGIDGIIRDGENGLLATPGDVSCLKEKIDYIFKMKENALVTMAANAYDTACNMKDSQVAEEYLKEISV